MLQPLARWIGLGLVLLSSSGTMAAEPIPVSAQPLSALLIHPTLSAPATVLSDNDSQLSSEVSARIVAIPVRVGDTVAAGTLLLRLESEDFRLALAREQAAAKSLAARVELARYDLQRARQLAKTQAVSDEILKQREADLASLLADQEGQQAAVAAAQRQLDKTEIRAPFAAVVTARSAQLGELANPGTPLLRIVDAEQLEVAASVQAHLADSLQAAPAPALRLDDRQLPLRLRVITPVIDATSRTREALLLFAGDKAGDQALPGSAGELVWREPQPHLPAEFVLRRAGKLGTFVIEGSGSAAKARFIALSDAEEGRPAPSTLAPETLIVTEGRYRLQDGDAVRVLP
jgi:RND family efflux transporter MFP subunit